MRKAKVVAIVCGMIASCLFGGFAVVEAATITLDDSSTTELAETTESAAATETAATETSIETTAPAATSTTTISESEETEETTAAAPETEAPESTTAAIVMTEAAQTAAHAAPIEVKVPGKASKPAETTAPKATTAATTKATTQATTKATTRTTTQTTTVTTTTQTTTEAIKVEEATVPPMPEQNVGYVATLEEPFIFEIPPVEEQTPAQAPAVVVSSPITSISDSDYVLICNAVAHEAGANSIPVTEKAKVVEVIMNRVASSKYPNTVYGVLTQKYQFSGSSTYVNLTGFSYKVTDMVKEAVDLYFADPSAFNEGYLSFTGDGKQNYFR